MMVARCALIDFETVRGLGLTFLFDAIPRLSQSQTRGMIAAHQLKETSQS
jgi:hypothetical protein